MLGRLAAAEGVLDLNVHETPIAFLRRMSTCAVVLSTSLHGLVFAEALGIPNLWVKAGDRLPGGEFKFHDWFSTTARPQLSPWRLTEADSASALATQAALHESVIDAAALTGAFPHAHLSALTVSARPWDGAAAMVRRALTTGRYVGRPRR